MASSSLEESPAQTAPPTSNVPRISTMAFESASTTWSSSHDEPSIPVVVFFASGKAIIERVAGRARGRAASGPAGRAGIPAEARNSVNFVVWAAISSTESCVSSISPSRRRPRVSVSREARPVISGSPRKPINPFTLWARPCIRARAFLSAAWPRMLGKSAWISRRSSPHSSMSSLSKGSNSPISSPSCQTGDFWWF